ncbi:MAG TPA: ROK family protein [Acidimicrobiia bacterium]|nr:ROK family protein [Acidimicrobiia bacterium]
MGNHHAALTAGVDIGGTKLLAVAATEKGEIVAERRQPTAAGPDAILAATTAVVADLVAAEPAIAAVGVGLPGLVDLEGTVHYAPNLPGFVGVRAQERLAAGCPVPVTVDNDANVAALGEVVHGAGRGHRDVLVVTLGTGIGGGLIIDGEVHRGGRGFGAEIGHFTVDPDGPPCACGGRGHWEAIASGTALGRRAREWAARGDAPSVLARAAGVAEAVTGHDVGLAATAGEADGLAILTEHAGAVAVGLGGLVNILDPEIVVISGGLVELGDLLLEPLRAALPEHVEGAGYRPVPPVLPAELGEHAGAVGAAALARTLLPSS